MHEGNQAKMRDGGLKIPSGTGMAIWSLLDVSPSRILTFPGLWGGWIAFRVGQGIEAQRTTESALLTFRPRSGTIGLGTPQGGDPMYGCLLVYLSLVGAWDLELPPANTSASGLH